VDQLTAWRVLSALGEGSLDSAQTNRAVAYIAIVSDLENIGDFIDKTLGITSAAWRSAASASLRSGRRSL
jgi:Na+/phosphate symporter